MSEEGQGQEATIAYKIRNGQVLAKLKASDAKEAPDTSCSYEFYSSDDDPHYRIGEPLKQQGEDDIPPSESVEIDDETAARIRELSQRGGGEGGNVPT